MNNHGAKFMSAPFWLYVAVWFFYLYVFIQIVNYGPDSAGNVLVSAMSFISFGVHEISHLLVFFLPSIFVASAGTVGELLFPTIIVVAAMRAKTYFASIFGILWLMLSMRSVGRYMADARAQVLPLSGPGDDPQHDWHFIFSYFNVLDSDTKIGAFVSALGVVVGALGLAYGIYLIILKLTDNSATTENKLA